MKSPKRNLPRGYFDNSALNQLDQQVGSISKIISSGGTGGTVSLNWDRTVIVGETQTYKSIQQAINSVSAKADQYHPWLVLVLPGIYTEQVIMKSYVNVGSIAGKDATMLTSALTTLIMASYCSLVGFTVVTTGATSAIDLASSSSFNIFNCLIQTLSVSASEVTDQSQGSSSQGQNDANAQAFSQTFTVGARVTEITSVTLKLAYISTGTFTIQIRTVDSQEVASALPTGTILATTSSLDRALYPNGTYNFVFINPAVVIPGTVYAIYIPIGPGLLGYGDLVRGTTGAGYTNGKAWRQASITGTWVAASLTDLYFSTFYRSIIGSGVSISNTGATDGLIRECVLEANTGYKQVNGSIKLSDNYFYGGSSGIDCNGGIVDSYKNIFIGNTTDIDVASGAIVNSYLDKVSSVINAGTFNEMGEHDSKILGLMGW